MTRHCLRAEDEWVPCPEMFGVDEVYDKESDTWLPQKRHPSEHPNHCTCSGTGRVESDVERVIEVKHMPGKRSGEDRGCGSGDYAAVILSVDAAFNIGSTTFFGSTPGEALSTAREALRESEPAPGTEAAGE